MVISPVFVSLILFIGSLLAVSGFYLIHALVDRLLAEAPAADQAADLTYSPLSD